MNYLDTMLGFETYQERLRKSEKTFLFQSAKPKRNGAFSGLTEFLGNILIATGQHLKGQGRITYVRT